MYTHKGLKPKTIKKVLSSKLNEWIESITDVTVRNAVQKDALVTGGSIASMILGEPVNDYDVYFKSHETVKLVAEYYANLVLESHPGSGIAVNTELEINIKGEEELVTSILIPSAGSITLEENVNPDDIFDSDIEPESDATDNDTDNDKPKYRLAFISPHAITLTNKIQIVLRFYGTPEQIHKNFDFVHAQGVYDLKENELTIPNKTLLALTSRTLLYSGSLYPIASLFRSKKFIERGWKISAGEYLKIAFQISTLDLKNLKVLKQQLTGVDMLYLKMVYNAMETAFKSNPELNIDSHYVVELIDKIFDF